jgi:hypothetical protein
MFSVGTVVLALSGTSEVSWSIENWLCQCAKDVEILEEKVSFFAASKINFGELEH